MAATEKPILSECVVCYEETHNTVAPCGHGVCETCIDAWIARGHRSCPTCRGLLVATRPVGVTERNCVRIYFHHRSDAARPSSTFSSTTAHHVGVTFGNVAGGVRVLALHPRDRGVACGLAVGDVVTHINAIPVNDHRTAAEMTDRGTAARHTLVYRLALRSSRHRIGLVARLMFARTRAL